VKFQAKELGLGVVNSRIDAVESPADICRSVEDALHLYEPDQIFLNPDCGFGTFSRRPMATPSVAVAKLRAMVDAAHTLRSRVEA
jgi:5-methyltetrahydropteroyltriglutamate--homocysteine methyltransferase